MVLIKAWTVGYPRAIERWRTPIVYNVRTKNLLPRQRQQQQQQQWLQLHRTFHKASLHLPILDANANISSVFCMASKVPLDGTDPPALRCSSLLSHVFYMLSSWIYSVSLVEFQERVSQTDAFGTMFTICFTA